MYCVVGDTAQVNEGGWLHGEEVLDYLRLPATLPASEAMVHSLPAVRTKWFAQSRARGGRVEAEAVSPKQNHSFDCDVIVFAVHPRSKWLTANGTRVHPLFALPLPCEPCFRAPTKTHARAQRAARAFVAQNQGLLGLRGPAAWSARVA